MLQTLIRHTLRVPRAAAPAGDGSAVARQLDVVLLSAGFKADRALLTHLSTVEPGAAMDLAVAVIDAVRGLVGDHVRHNAYFKKFPRRVPDTVEFWVSLLRRTNPNSDIPRNLLRQIQDWPQINADKRRFR